jgi:hypothetical protein
MKSLPSFSTRPPGVHRFSPQFPVIDCNYQVPPYVDLGGGHCAGAPRSSFRNISRDYFRDEAPYNFAAEAALFAAIVLTAGLAIAIAAVAAIDFLRVLGYL